MATVEPAESRFAAHKSLYAIDPITGEASKLTASTGWSVSNDATLLSILILEHAHDRPGMLWVWAQISPPKTNVPASMPNLVLSVPPAGRARANATQLVGSSLDDPTADIARRLSARFKRPVFVSLNAGTRRQAQGMMAVAAEQMDELMTTERCIVAELIKI
ncbi:hypothetical protein IWW36_002768 [Coemansia brasiliensis]|uniref:Uncharacterized protein n=1 Tax=Coemansia brasiliensis TaxID=2650707 RepID=A0A9W8IE36_9FUNG|nr:hypothetical protein IWW36_002768 [Coemansia brasiliensis]